MDQRVYSEIQWKYQRNNTSEKSYRENKVMEWAWGRSEGSTDQDWPFTVETTFGMESKTRKSFWARITKSRIYWLNDQFRSLWTVLGPLYLPWTDTYEKASNEK